MKETTMTTLKKTCAATIALLLAMMTVTLVASPSADAGWSPSDLGVATTYGGGSQAECPSGSFEDMHGKCRKPVADAVGCPDGALGVPGACYIFVKKEITKTGWACPTGSVEDNKGKCRKPVANAVTCPERSTRRPRRLLHLRRQGHAQDLQGRMISFF